MRQINNGSETCDNEYDYVVAIGASAGGLVAINEFFDNMPETGHLAFVVIQHLSPDHKSLMSELISKHTSMQVHVAEDGMIVKPENIYLIPEKMIMTLKNNALHLKERVK